jgi:hypothetical protein
VELDAGAELNATECSEVADAELNGGTDHGSGHGRRMERDRDGRRKSRWRVGDVGEGCAASGAGRVCPTSGGGTCNRTDQLYEIK